MVTFMDFIISEVGFSSTCFGWFAVISLVLYHWLAPAKTGIAIAAITIVMVPVPPLKKFVITCHGVYAMFSPKKFCTCEISFAVLFSVSVNPENFPQKLLKKAMTKNTEKTQCRFTKMHWMKTM